MTHPSRHVVVLPLLAISVVAGFCVGGATAQTGAPASPSAVSAPAAQTVRMRGVVQAITPVSMTVKDRSGEVVELVTTDKLVVTEVYPIALADIKKGSYIGTAALPQPDGTLKAIAVTVFTEAQRNVPDGHTPFNLQPHSTMTNAIVEDIGTLGDASGGGAGNAGRQLQLKYKAGEKMLDVPADTPVVTSRPGNRNLLVVGASVSLFAQVIDGKPTALRVNAGKNGFPLPY
jgi:hypothetical protein